MIVVSLVKFGEVISPYNWATDNQGLSQDLESGCLKLAIVKFLDVQIFKGGNNIFKFQP